LENRLSAKSIGRQSIWKNGYRTLDASAGIPADPLCDYCTKSGDWHLTTRNKAVRQYIRNQNLTIDHPTETLTA
jgi:hypothetical protein